MAHRLSPSEETLLARFQERLLAAVPAGSVRAIIVFGSRARGNSGPNSDLDVAVMLAPGVERAPMQRIVFDTGYDIGEELDLLELGLAPIALPLEPRIALHNSIDRDGMEIWRA